MPTSKCSGHSTRCSSGTCGANRRNAWSPRKKHSARYAAAALSTSSTSSAGTPEPSLYRSSGLPAAIPSIAASSAQVRSEIPIQALGDELVTLDGHGRLADRGEAVVDDAQPDGPGAPVLRSGQDQLGDRVQRAAGWREVHPTIIHRAPAAPEAGSGGSRK